MQRVTIVGSGFAGLTAVRKLRALSKDLEITLVSPKPEFVFLPGLIWVPSGIRSGDDLCVPLEDYFGKMNVHYHQAEATGLKDGGRTLVTSNGEIENDGLIIASGGRFMKKLPGIEHAITPCEGVDAAKRIRDRLRAMQGGTVAIGFSGNPKESSAMRGGPMFEFLFGIDQQLRNEGRRNRFRLVFFAPVAEPGKRLGKKAMDGLLAEMKKRGIDTHLGHKLVGFEADRVKTEGGEFTADLILFMPGMTGNQWFDNSELPRSEGGLIKADGHCRVEGMARVYVAGDSGSFPGPEWMPKQAHMADLQAEAAVANLVAELNGRQPQETFRVELVCIVDSQNSGMLVARTPKHSIVMPSMRIFHWLKRFFEWWYLFKYR